MTFKLAFSSIISPCCSKVALFPKSRFALPLIVVVPSPTIPPSIVVSPPKKFNSPLFAISLLYTLLFILFETLCSVAVLLVNLTEPIMFTIEPVSLKIAPPCCAELLLNCVPLLMYIVPPSLNIAPPFDALL